MPLLVIGGVLLYLRFADLSGWRDTAAKLASDAIGRELRINGQFRPEFGLTTTTESQLFGQTRNPWNLDHTAGGSTGISVPANRPLPRVVMWSL